MSGEELFVMLWLLGVVVALAFVARSAWRDFSRHEPIWTGCFVVASVLLLLCYAALFGGLAWWLATR